MRAESKIWSTESLDPACERAQLLITRHIDGEAAPEDALALRAHLAACARCRKSLEVQSAQSAELALALKNLWPGNPDDPLKKKDALTASEQRRHKRQIVLRAASLVIVALVLAAFAHRVFAPSDENTPDPEPALSTRATK